MMKKIVFLISLVVFLSCSSVFAVIGNAAEFKVLVVMSYEKPEQNPWCNQIKEGIESVLGSRCDIDYFYMDTKINLDGGTQKAKEAYALYKKKAYDGVIAADDNAQSMFVVPYLSNKVKTPVIFCGVNSDTKKYGYPSANVTGILERGHFRESIAFAKQLLPGMKKIGFISKMSPSGKALKKQVDAEANTYLAKVVVFELIKTLADLKHSKKMRGCDAIFIDSLEGITNHMGEPLSTREIVPYLNDYFGKPLIGANTFHVESGALCAVVKSGQEQGEGAGEKLLEAMQGKAVSLIPVTRNYKGRRLINVSMLKAFNINPKPVSLLGTILVKTAQ